MFDMRGGTQFAGARLLYGRVGLLQSMVWAQPARRSRRSDRRTLFCLRHVRWGRRKCRPQPMRVHSMASERTVRVALDARVKHDPFGPFHA
jgi:hypothetical protein